MAEKDVQYSRALRSVARLEGDAVERARVAGEQARADAPGPGRKATSPAAVVSVPALGPYVPAGLGEAAARAAGAQMLEAINALGAD